jgi:hypothetical protein
MRRFVLILLPLIFGLGGCLNAPEKERADLRNDVDRTDESDEGKMRADLRAMLIGGVDTPPESDPHLRAEAARGLGNLASPEDSGVLLDLLLGDLADESVAVRWECAIALGKLKYAGRSDKRRIEVVQSLRNRIAFDRDDDGRPNETEFMVRSAMLNSMIALGGRDAAVAVHDVAERVYGDLEDVEASLYTSATDRGLLDRCFQGLAELTGAGEQAAAQNRFDTKNLDEHLDWWAQQISDMPEGQ